MGETERRVHRELNVRRDCRHSQREKPGPPFRELGIWDYLGIFQNRAVQDLPEMNRAFGITGTEYRNSFFIVRRSECVRSAFGQNSYFDLVQYLHVPERVTEVVFIPQMRRCSRRTRTRT